MPEKTRTRDQWTATLTEYGVPTYVTGTVLGNQFEFKIRIAYWNLWVESDQKYDADGEVPGDVIWATVYDYGSKDRGGAEMVLDLAEKCLGEFVQSRI